MQDFQFLLDPHDAPALPVPSEDPSHDVSLPIIDDQVLLSMTIIAEAGPGESGGVGMHGATSDAPSDIGAFLLAPIFNALFCVSFVSGL